MEPQSIALHSATFKLGCYQSKNVDYDANKVFNTLTTTFTSNYALSTLVLPRQTKGKKTHKVKCPHCGRLVKLFVDRPMTLEQRRRSARVMWSILFVKSFSLFLLGTLGFVYCYYSHKQIQKEYEIVLPCVSGGLCWLGFKWFDTMGGFRRFSFHDDYGVWITTDYKWDKDERHVQTRWT